MGLDLNKTSIYIICGVSLLLLTIVVITFCVCLYKRRGCLFKSCGTVCKNEEVATESASRAVLPDVFVSTSSQELPASLHLVKEGRRLPRPQLSDANDGRNELVLSNISKPVPPTTYSKPRLHDGTNMLDLHGYYLDEAMDLFKEFIQEKKDVYYSEGCQQQDRYAIVITGRGLHSPDGVPVIRNNVVEFLEDEGYNYRFVRNNSGRIRVDLA